ncbi:SPRY domain-containing protein 4-like isoform X2 [Sinocyclocheilus rhinocerous]|uniref:SPRY domain-containing protein 4-like n=1 Tax=Sinocyclocheilus rhinocerous TaxID=307959 RepID=A0A673HQ64_9TELE|nr:PREDICTED: SPRY domain-containing protein 4-like isoform X1 [Sinocyclocheilus rhinocerous]XP_016397786.1 PREDICTED: SPRY domain-containing protein 4-like isoform X2 [Sinocyclocheilus rhinocerous]
MAMSSGMSLFCRLTGRSLGSVLGHGRGKTLTARRWYISASAGNDLQFKLDERTAHSSLDLFKKDTGVIYRMLGVDPTLVQDTPLRFRDWAVVLADTHIDSGRYYWEVTVKKSHEFRVGVAEVLTSRDECVGTNSSSWVFAFVQRKWFAMTTGKQVPVPLVGKPDRVGLLLDYEAGRLSLVDIQKAEVVYTIKTQFRSPICPAFALWDGELLTHSGLEIPPGL